LEANGNVKSAWETGDGGPARRVYRLTRKGEEHLEEWAVVLEHLAKSMDRFVRDARRSPKKPASARACAA
jgi:DNA-binding PadR family transcriptional regulator